MDIVEIHELNKICDELIQHAKDYDEHLKLANQYRDKFKIVLSSKIADLKAFKSNIGIEMAELVLMQPGFLDFNSSVEVMTYWDIWKKNETYCHGLEKIIEAKSIKLSFAQSQMKYIKDNT